MPLEFRPFAPFLDEIFATIGNRSEIILNCQNSDGPVASLRTLAYALLVRVMGSWRKTVGKGKNMARAMRPKALEVIARQRAEDAMWGIPESPEFSSVQRLMNEFQSHATHEKRWLSSYQEIGKETSDPQIQFLLGLIVADEERHHELTNRMISKLKDEMAWSRASGPLRRTGKKGEKRKRLLMSVESFLEAERRGMEEYEQLKTKSQELHRDVFALLYTTMIHDSHKHIGILEFLRLKLKGSRSPARKRHA
jgi:rubrerythrin